MRAIDEEACQAGFTVLAFDYRRLGESGGQPRQITRIREQHADWQAAIELAKTRRGVDPARIAIWGFSLSGGHLFPVAARNSDLAAAIAQTPLVSGPAGAPTALRHTTPLASLRLTGRGLLDAAGGLVGREPLLVPLAGKPGTVAMISTPDALDGDKALNPGNRYAEGGGRPLSAAHRPLPARSLRLPSRVPPARARLRSRQRGAHRTHPPCCEAGSA
jgi:uncharacterized protein